MKKLVIVMALAAFLAVAGAAQAQTFVKKDNFTYEIKGDWQIQYREETPENSDIGLEYDDLEIKNYAAYALNDSVTLFGELDFSFDGSNDQGDSVDLEEAYLGVKYNDMRFLFGKTDSASDAFGVTQNYENTGSMMGDDIFDHCGVTGGDDLFLFDGQFGMFSVMAGYELDSGNGNPSNSEGQFFDILVGLNLNNFSAGVAFQNRTPAGMDDDYNIWGIQAGYDAGFLAIGVDYGVAEGELDSTTSDDVSMLNVSLVVPVDAFTFGGGYQLLSYDEDGKDDVNGWYLNATYAFPAAQNVTVFAELEGNDDDNEEMGYLVGMELKF